jgi:hypothetical protein
MQMLTATRRNAPRQRVSRPRAVREAENHVTAN